MATPFASPIDSVATFRNRQLAPVINRQGGPAPSASIATPAQGAMSSSGEGMSGFANIRQNASRQHQLYLQAIKATRARQQPRVANMAGNGTYSYSGGPAGNPKGLVGRYKLLPGADQALTGLNAAYRQTFGKDMPINSGGRTYAEQQHLYNLYRAGRGNLAAKPGTSEHESGRAVDFGGALHHAGTREHNWLVQNAGRFGFKWTGKNFRQFEAWHFEWWG